MLNSVLEITRANKAQEGAKNEKASENLNVTVGEAKANESLEKVPAGLLQKIMEIFVKQKRYVSTSCAPLCTLQLNYV
jgi:flagellar motor switch protein FliG